MERREFLKTAAIATAGLMIAPGMVLARPSNIFDALTMEGWKYRKRTNGIGHMYEIWHPDRCLTGRLWCWEFKENDLRPLGLFLDKQIISYDFPIATEDNRSSVLNKLHDALRKTKNVDGWDGISRVMSKKGYRLENWHSASWETTLFFESPTRGKMQIMYHNSPVKAPGRIDYWAHWYYNHKALNGYTYTGWSETAQGLVTWLAS